MHMDDLPYPLTLNLEPLLRFAREHLAVSGVLQAICIRSLAPCVFQVELTMRQAAGNIVGIHFVQKQSYSTGEVTALQALQELSGSPARLQLIDWAALPEGGPTHWFVTPFCPGNTLTFDDEVPASIIDLLAQMHARFALRVHEFADLYRIDASAFRAFCDNALGIIKRALDDKPHEVLTEAHHCVTAARANPQLYAALAALPLTLTHGDVHPGNIICADDGRATLIDWGNARIAPAMLDLANMVAIDSPNWERYLGAWSAASGETMDRRLARLGYYWATVMVNIFYLPYAVDFTPPENVRLMVGKIIAAERQVAKLLEPL